MKPNQIYFLIVFILGLTGLCSLTAGDVAGSADIAVEVNQLELSKIKLTGSFGDEAPSVGERQLRLLAFSSDFATDHVLIDVESTEEPQVFVYKSSDEGRHWQPFGTMGHSNFALSSGFGKNSAWVTWDSDRPLIWLGKLGEKYARAAMVPNVDGITSVFYVPSDSKGTTLYLSGWVKDEEYDVIEKSEDGGATWATLHTAPKLVDLTISPSFTQDHTLVALVMQHPCNSCDIPDDSDYLETSKDGGDSWNSVQTDQTDLNNLVLSPAYATDHTLAVAGEDDGLVLLSNDGGASLTDTHLAEQLSKLIKISGTQRLVFSPNYANDKLIFAYEGGSPGVAVYNGIRWSLVTVGDSDDGIVSLAISPDFAKDHLIMAVTHKPRIWISRSLPLHFEIPKPAGD